MFVRRLQEKEILDGLHLVWEVFAEANAPYMSPEGVSSFQQFIKMENFMPQVADGRMTMFGAMEGNELVGVCAVKAEGHVSLLFVKKSWQRHGAAKMLMQETVRYCVNERKAARITVNAAPQAVEAYRHLGFVETMVQKEENGICFVPMEQILPHGSRQNSKKKSHPGLYAGVGITVALLMGLLVFLIGKIAFTVAESIERLPQQQYGQQGSQPFEKGGNGEAVGEKPEEEPSDPKKEGIESIACYEAERLPYVLKEEKYTYSSDGRSGEYPMEFDISYPQIEGLDSEKADEINKRLKACAMSTVETIYLNPSDAMKEAMLQEKNPFLASQVTYKVTYAGEDFISVVFSDHYFVGNFHAEFSDLRTRNIRLSDGEQFETKNIVDLSNEFMAEWMARMRKEAPKAAVLTGLKSSQFRKILNGEILENRYYDNFFVDAEGIQIGMTYHYTDEEKTVISRGWITAPFKMKEIMKYKKDNDFWNLVQSNN